ncbi:MAG TPA: hypothetical protein VMZ03_02145 [Chitinophagaceae bacterium]|nr:hypothetical protein [Chitinophagaceae bacterium]
MSYSKKIARIPLTPDGQFVVSEEKALNYILAVLFFALFCYGVGDAMYKKLKQIDYQSYVFALAIAPAIYCVRRARKKRIYIRINKTGIYQDERLITPWSDLLHAYISQKEKTKMINLMDNFLLVVEYKKDGKGIRRQLPLTNTQNRSEEEVLEAVNFFWKRYTAGSI